MESAPSGAAAAADPSEESMYIVDKEALAAVRKAKSWHEGQGTTSPKYFKRAVISAAATVKMLQHAIRGVDKGMASENGMPHEIMGLIIGRPSTDPQDPHYLVVTDAFPLPVDGVETRVEAGDEAMNFMVGLSDSLELTREECIMGWYHSHPFDVGETPQWFFSAVDCQNNLAWQKNEDAQGNPWLGLVIDPLRSIAKGKPEIGAFRSFLPAYTQVPELSPSGEAVVDKAAVVKRWGHCWNRYYCLEVDYFMSDLTRRVVKVLSKNFLWMSVLSTSLKNEREYRDRFSDRVNAIAGKIENASSRSRSGPISTGIPSSMSGTGGMGKKSEGNKESSLGDACVRANDIAVESSLHDITQVSKQTLFGLLQAFTSHKCSAHHHHHT